MTQAKFHCHIYEAVKQGHQVNVFNRGKTAGALPAGINSTLGNMPDEVAHAQLGAQKFVVVCQFMALTAEQVKRDVHVCTSILTSIF